MLHLSFLNKYVSEIYNEGINKFLKVFLHESLILKFPTISIFDFWWVNDFFFI